MRHQATEHLDKSKTKGQFQNSYAHGNLLAQGKYLNMANNGDIQNTKDIVKKKTLSSSCIK